MKRRKSINFFGFFVHSVLDNFITFITSRVARDTERVIDGLYNAKKIRKCSERNARVVLSYGLHHISLFFCLK